MASRRSEISVLPTGAALGADIEGINLSSQLHDEAVEAIKSAWRDHLVLRFRGQRLSDADLLRFSRYFGDLDRAPVNVEHVKPEEGYVTVISNVIVNGQAIGGLGAYEAEWHTDMSYVEAPPLGSVLYALEVPPSGGDTGFANMYTAFEQLTPELKEQVLLLTAKHDASRNSAGELRRGFTEVTDPREAPGAVHPIVITHPETGRRALYLGRRRNEYIPGLSLEQSEQLLDCLWNHATREEFLWYQKWKVGDLLMWDNRCTLHRRDAFDPTTRRIMHRTQIKTGHPGTLRSA
jgi:taurine dioxygenase